jgi:hypothetical protein
MSNVKAQSSNETKAMSKFKAHNLNYIKRKTSYFFIVTFGFHLTFEL